MASQPPTPILSSERHEGKEQVATLHPSPPVPATEVPQAQRKPTTRGVPPVHRVISPLLFVPLFGSLFEAPNWFFHQCVRVVQDGEGSGPCGEERHLDLPSPYATGTNQSDPSGCPDQANNHRDNHPSQGDYADLSGHSGEVERSYS